MTRQFSTDTFGWTFKNYEKLHFNSNFFNFANKLNKNKTTKKTFYNSYKKQTV